MHFMICRVERRKGLPDDDSAVFSAGHVCAENELDAAAKILSMGFTIRGQERLIMIPLNSFPQIQEATEIERQRIRAYFECKEVLERINLSVD